MAFNLEEFVNKYNVHPEALAFLEANIAAKTQPYYELGITGARNARIKEAEVYAGTTEFFGTEKEFICPSPYFTEGVPISVYRPESCDQLSAPSILVYFHGGGNTVGCRRTHATTCKILAREACCLVVNVEYRLAPEHKFPASNDDAKSAVRWISMNKSLIGAVNASVIGVAGDSSGGRIAAVISHELSDIIHFSILIHPYLNYNLKDSFLQEFREGPILTWRILRWFLKQYISQEDCNNPRASPILNKRFSHLPPTLIIVAELDPLRDSSYAYYEKLKEAEVDVDILTMKGVTHGFWSLPAHFKECCQQAYDKAVDFIKAHSKSAKYPKQEPEIVP